MRSFVFAGMNRAKGASFSTNETVVDENPLARATSRIVTDEAFRRRRFTIKLEKPPRPKSQRIIHHNYPIGPFDRVLVRRRVAQGSLGVPAQEFEFLGFTATIPGRETQ